MKIEKNILKEYLNNVYIIGGNACAGKSTISKALSEKYGITLYKMDEEYDRHRSFADKQHQPEMCFPRDNIYEFFNRPVVKYADSLQKAVKEEVPMVLMDLVCLAKNGPVIADVLFDPGDIDGIIPDERAVFLTSNEELVRQDYFNRPEKRAFYEAIQKYPDPESSFENVISVVNLINQRGQQCISEKNAFHIARTPENSVENTLQQIEKHFGLTKVLYRPSV